jgi:predicted DNA-binding ribbon-helix-helix protein
MCQLFVGADPALWEPVTHSMRLHKGCTSIRIERFFWGVLETIAARDGLSLNELLTRLYDELLEAERDELNFASFLRVCCGRYLELSLSGDIPASGTIRALDAGAILRREELRGYGFTARPRLAAQPAGQG